MDILKHKSFFNYIGPIVFTIGLISAPNQAFASNTSPTYTVKTGDTLWAISQHAGVNINKIIELNPKLVNPNYLKVGQILNLPVQDMPKAASQLNGSPLISLQTVKQTVSSEQSSTKDPKQKIGQGIISTGKKLLGKPYKYGAQSMNPSSFDCSSFTQYVYGVNHIKLNRVASQQATQGQNIDKGQMREGDLVFFWNNDTQNQKGLDRIGHVGIYLGDGKFIHCSTSDKGVIISDINDKYYLKTFICARRVIL
ncbi:LysM peptidoglycan-binding domain-containing protein [Heliobacillus mobilis]|uniref:LysM peptidoglycan-binding domain-containing protein n=1 Tax=Heliobacterium mobile TaxID=28064 RepID=A0A6I3SP77_HELMO|nr:NlpC/P60 family protein [Heliobacterium mobile]MTV50863.1 LysM peptidoglycan-binding domain-containing protein [Heliobacterium mobile]